jgi:LuxR family transcriptional regulator, maltose regulon positive regulatory protein
MEPRFNNSPDSIADRPTFVWGAEHAEEAPERASLARWGANDRSRARPRRSGLVGRQEIVARCAQDSNAVTTLLSAPAGYGKTTVLSQWEDADSRPFAWLTLDERFNDPVLLLGSIAAALDELEPLGGDIPASLQAPSPDLSNVVVPRLCEALARRETPFVLVLDDVNRLSHPESLRPLGAIAESVPVGSKLALASRTEPAIPLGRLRAERLLIELHATDLAMTQPEASALLEQAGLELDQGSVESLIERTEGWPAGLYLAALALLGQNNVDGAVERFLGDNRFLADYLREEFLAGLSETDLDFLTRTSILGGLSGPLCDAVLEREGSGNVLRRLARSNLLLIPVDLSDSEYRYHTLMQEMLKSELHRLGEDEEAKLHARAARWYASTTDIDHAITHAIAARDLELAADLIWAVTPDYASTGRVTTLRHWLETFDNDQLAASPPLCVALATTHLTRGDGAEVERWTATAAEALKSVDGAGDGPLAMAVRMLRAAGAARDGVVAMRDDVAGVYELLPEDSPWRSLCRMIEGVSYHLTGDLDRAPGFLEEGARQGAATTPSTATICRAQLVLFALDEDDPEQADALADQTISDVDHFGLKELPTSALTYAAAALAHATSGRATEAADEVKASESLLANLHELSPWYEAETRIVLARTLLLLEDVARARAHLADAGRYLHRTPDAITLRNWVQDAWERADAAKTANGRWPLSPAELRILRFLPTHLTFPEIAAELCLSPNTVKTHSQAIYQKLGAASRNEAVVCARAAGLLETSEANA